MLKPEAIRRYRLSKRQAEVIGMMCDGHSEKAIANELFLATNSVSSRMSEGYRRLGVRSDREAMAKLYRERLVEMPPEPDPVFDIHARGSLP